MVFSRQNIKSIFLQFLTENQNNTASFNEFRIKRLNNARGSAGKLLRKREDICLGTCSNLLEDCPDSNVFIKYVNDQFGWGVFAKVDISMNVRLILIVG